MNGKWFSVCWIFDFKKILYATLFYSCGMQTSKFMVNIVEIHYHEASISTVDQRKCCLLVTGAKTKMASN
jgi:hypothetical protein